MAVYTPKTLRTPTILTASAVTVYTAPGSTTAIIRTINAVSNSAADTFTMSIGADAQGTRIFDTQPLTEDVTFIRNGFWVVETGVIVQALASGASAVALGFFGYEYA